MTTTHPLDREHGIVVRKTGAVHCKCGYQPSRHGIVEKWQSVVAVNARPHPVKAVEPANDQAIYEWVWQFPITDIDQTKAELIQEATYWLPELLEETDAHLAGPITWEMTGERDDLTDWTLTAHAPATRWTKTESEAS